MSWYFFQLPILCVVAAIFDLDASHVGQWMFSRPVVVAPLLGWYLGKFGVGVWVGVTLELLILDDLPMGHWVPLNGAVAAASILLLAVGRTKVPLPAAFPAGLLLGFMFKKIEVAVRSWRRNMVYSAETAVDRGRGLSGLLIARGICAHAAACATFLYIAVVATEPILAEGWLLLPQRMQAGMDLALQTAPWLGLATLTHVLKPR